MANVKCIVILIVNTMDFQDKWKQLQSYMIWGFYFSGYEVL
jgi:hypothetical protein